MEIDPTPASLAQVLKGRDGKFIAIEDDVYGVARELHQIDPHLRLRYSEAGQYFVIYFQHNDGSQDLVTTAQELDPRIITRIRKITSETYNFSNELARIDAAADREKERKLNESIQDHAERLAHALRQDFGANRDADRNRRSRVGKIKGISGYNR